MRLVLLGPPGAGKGTQAGAIAATYGIPHISTGDIFRDNARRRTPLGLEAESFMERGALVPDEVVINMITDRLGQDDARAGFLLDGFPRTVPQAIALEDALAAQSSPLDAVLRFVIDDEEVVVRLVKRGAIEGRADDTADVIRRRLEEYHVKTEPLEAFYAERGQLRDVEAIGPVEEITRRALTVLEDVRGSSLPGGAG
jgi:adenylate kinase